jgi:hypothetical protein
MAEWKREGHTFEDPYLKRTNRSKRAHRKIDGRGGQGKV